MKHVARLYRRIHERLMRAGRRPRDGGGEGPATKIVLISLHKSGTHLIRNLFDLLGYSRVSIDGRGPEMSDFRGLTDRQYLISHFPPATSVNVAMHKGRAKIIFNYRDPRDVCVSTLDFFDWRGKPTAFQHIEFLREAYRHRFEHRADLLSSIIRCERFAGYPFDLGFFYDCRALLFHPGVLKVSYEALVGPRGGGDAAVQRMTVQRILDYVGAEADVDRLVADVYSSGTRTFNRGVLGRWREEFEEEHVRLFEERHGLLLDEYGYREEDRAAAGGRPGAIRESVGSFEAREKGESK